MRTTDPKKWTRSCISLIALITLAGTALDCRDSPSSPTAITPSSGSPEPAVVACFTTSPDPPDVEAGTTIELDAGCTENLNADTTFTWLLGDGRTESGRRVAARYRRAGEYVIRLSVTNGETSSTAAVNVHVRPGLAACFAYRQVLGGEEPCTVDFDATCSAGDVREFRWFFEGGPFPPYSPPDANVTTTEPSIEHSWADDMECFAFRPFARKVRLTVVDGQGRTDSHEEVVSFSVPFERR